MKTLIKFWNDTRGATAIEYGLITALIALAIIVGLTAVGQALIGAFNNAGSAF